jgi:molybdopterin-binding protein
MRISARNQIKGTVKSVKEGAVNTQVMVDIGGHVITSMITSDSVKELGIAQGKEVYVVIKASEVMLAVD